MNSSHTLKNNNTQAHWDGDAYGKINQPQQLTNQVIIKAIDFSGDEHVLDIGCGNGDTSRLIASLVPQGEVLAIDASASMIKAARGKENPCHLQFLCQPAESIEYFNQFDLITCFFCMQWIADKETVFRQIKQALKNNGYFYLAVPMPHSILPKLREELIQQKQWRDYFIDYPDPLRHINDCKYACYAKARGFAIQADQIKQKTIKFNALELFIKFMLQMTPHVERLPTAVLKRMFIEQLIASYLKEYQKNNRKTFKLLDII